MNLAEPDAKAQSVLDAMHQQIALLDTGGTVVAVNRAWREFGRANGDTSTVDKSLGVNYLDVCAASTDQAHAGPASAGIAAVLSGASSLFELEYPCHSPIRERWFLMRVSPLAGACRGALVAHEDITARWRLGVERDALIAELLTANRELNEFAYVVSHDLKAPLRGISSLATWLVEDNAGRLGDETAGQLKLIDSRVKRLSGLIDAILAYSRAGRTQVERSLVALDALVQNTIDLLAPPPHVTVQIARPLPQLWGQAAKLQQVFQNLLSNAIDFIDKPQGVVTVDCIREPDCWHFSVSDNGPGIEARHFERIFNLFQTLNARDELERTGVGLALVKKIVELEGGRLWVESVVGAGATFHFTLPAAGELSA